MERIKLNLIPSGVAPIVHLSQYDDGRQFGIDLFEGESVYVLDGTETLTVNSRKPDGHVVTLAVTNTGTSSVDVDTIEQLTTVHGVSYAKLQIEKGAVTIATLPFLIDVSRDPLENGDPSESFVHNLRTQIADGVAEEVAEQYDSSNVIFDNAPTSGHGTPYTVTSEGIKTAIDNAFDYDNTASGSIVHIEDGADNIPVKSLVSQIVAVETGSGEKSPDNPYTISGFDNGVVSVCGVNLWDEQSELGYYSSTGTKISATNQLRTVNKIMAKPSTAYYFKIPVSDYNAFAVIEYDVNGEFLRRVTPLSYSGDGAIYTTSPDCHYFNINIGSSYGNVYLNNISINYPSTDTQYHAYNGNTYTFAFGQTVYGGHFDNKGNLVVTHGYYQLTGSEDWAWGKSSIFSGGFYTSVGNVGAKANTPFICTHAKTALTISEYEWGTCFCDGSLNFRIMQESDTVEDWKTYLANQYSNGTPVSLCYELATPITLAITSQDIPTLLGENNIFSNTVDVEVNYYTNKANDILEFIDSEIGKKNGTNIPIEENSQDSIKNYIDNEVSTITTSISGKADKTEDATITVESGYTLISSSCGKTDRLVHLNFNVEKSGGFTTGWQVIGTTEFKPNTLAYCPLWNVTNGVGNGEVRIDTDGTINFYVVTAGELRLNANIGYVTS